MVVHRVFGTVAGEGLCSLGLSATVCELVPRKLSLRALWAGGLTEGVEDDNLVDVSVLS